MVRESPIVKADDDRVRRGGGGGGEWSAMLRAVVRGVRWLPLAVQRICNVQFFAWVAWFPFLFFATTWVTEIMARTGDISDPEFIDRATRAGSFALFLYSVTSLLCSIVLPAFVSGDNESESGGKIGLRRMWRFSLVSMGVTLLLTWVVDSVFGATVLIVAMAFPWALAMWAPFALVGEYVAIQNKHMDVRSNSGEEEEDVEEEEEDDEEEEYIVAVGSGSGSQRRSIGSVGSSALFVKPPGSRVLLPQAADPSSPALHDDDGDSQLAAVEPGMILGIHNMYVVFPQFVINGISSLIFAWLGHSGGGHSPQQQQPGAMVMAVLASYIPPSLAAEPVGLVLRIGGGSALMAAGLTTFLYDRQRLITESGGNR
ncbi:hypothetical protein IWW38_005610 [Coemansia aciculifera]|uniref:Uncharacterized protein n=1 Tax=Coemansia aciculifera TaxID=417176 RepID=A0ACC1LUK7_9FUNG|nr:hypothetical protein IWW38_005610 [Coemansia aciculifera]